MTKKQLIDALNNVSWLSDDTPVVVTYIGDDAQPGTDMYSSIVEVEMPEFEIYIEGLKNLNSIKMTIEQLQDLYGLEYLDYIEYLEQ